MEFEFLSTEEGQLLPFSHFEGCIFLLFFTRKRCSPCKQLVEKLNLIDFTKYPSLVLVTISMDKVIHDWDTCFKPSNWLKLPYFPAIYRKRLYGKYQVDRLPFLVVCDQYASFSIPSHIITGNQQELQEHLDFCINCFDVDEFVIV